ncbi:MAG: hypothetical protein QMD05_00620 [Candidatus Brocadiaceae bacterium]|nr:hypothetical protein [Candidatus Brocadiaceae bacterium]
MDVNKIIGEANEVASKYHLKLVEVDRTDNIFSLKLLVDNDLFIQIYGNIEKDKLNLTLVFKNRCLYGYDSEGGRYHCHPFDGPEGHVFVDKARTLQEFVQESMRLLEERDIL